MRSGNHRTTLVQHTLQVAVVCLLLSLPAYTQFSAPANIPSPAQLHWTPFGNTQVLAGVAGYASGAIERVWREEDGSVVVYADALGAWRTTDFATWTPDATVLPPVQPGRLGIDTAPLDARLVQVHPTDPTVVFALGSQVYRSFDGGRTFAGLTRYRGVSLLGEVLYDLVLNDGDPDDLLVASDLGLWRSRDAGLTWAPASNALDNLQLQRIVAFPEARRGLLVAQPGGRVLEWVPGAVNGWKPLSEIAAQAWRPPGALRLFADNLTAWDAHGSQLYVGLRSGVLAASADAGASWVSFSLPGWAAATQIAANPDDPLVALALARDENGRPLLLRTLNGGTFWEDVTPSDLPAITAIAPDWEANRLLLASGKPGQSNAEMPEAHGEIFVASFDFRAMTQPQLRARLSWQGVHDDIRELRLDPSGTLLFAVSQRSGVFFTALPALAAPHRVRHAADLGRRAVAPGDLLTIHGSPIVAMRANQWDAAVLGPGDHSTQVQLPYSLTSGRLSVELSAANGDSSRFALNLQRVSPAIFLHPDGSPFVLHAETGALIDENYPAAPGERVQILLSGLGAIRPDWPAGLPVPADSPPSVIASVEATLNGTPLPVSRAVLAPGYAGIYLVEVSIPSVLDEGLAELRVYADGTGSNVAGLHVAYP